MSGALLAIRGLEVAYGHIAAVRGVDLEVGPGEFVSVIGANGAGKSSILKALVGVTPLARGSIAFAGQEIGGLPSHRISRLGLALAPEGRGIFRAQTVEENLLLGAYARLRAGDRAVAADVEWTLGLFPRLRERFRHSAGLLSGGEQQMLAIARALVSRPKLLAVDEVSLGLAPAILDQLFAVLSQLNREGLAILLVEQIASRALAVTNRTYVVEQGRITLSGPSRTLAADPRVIEAYLGAPLDDGARSAQEARP
ncbi:ABC transporter ATP-binding protein [Methylopila musalis]|uniref:ABC transporter ATP-binding protein n=1 Tax=Methylopila musalis TaxID=1134781 RepID=A0ABW3Z9X0_9HYPH